MCQERERIGRRHCFLLWEDPHKKGADHNIRNIDCNNDIDNCIVLIFTAVGKIFHSLNCSLALSNAAYRIKSILRNNIYSINVNIG